MADTVGSAVTYGRDQLRRWVSQEMGLDRCRQVSATVSIRSANRLPAVKRLKAKLRPILRRGRGRNLGTVIREMKPIIRGWIAYFRLAEVKGTIEELDRWVRRKLRCIVWRQWKRPRTKFRELQRLGLDADRARLGAFNNHGPWWNAGQAHMNFALSTKYLRAQGLVSFIEEHRRLARAS